MPTGLEAWAARAPFSIRMYARCARALFAVAALCVAAHAAAEGDQELQTIVVTATRIPTPLADVASSSAPQAIAPRCASSRAA